VETKDALLPYPKRLTTSATVAQSTLPLPSHPDIVERASTESVPSVVPHEQAEVRDAWASYDAEASEAFWRNSSTTSSLVVNERTGKSAAGTEMPAITPTAAHDAPRTSDVEDCGRTSSGAGRDVSEWTRDVVFGKTTGATFDGEKNEMLSLHRACQSAGVVEKQETRNSLTAEEKYMGSISTNTRDDALMTARDSHDGDLSDTVADADCVVVGNEMEHDECRMEESSLNVDEFVRDHTNSCTQGSVPEANMSAAECICHSRTECDAACTVSGIHIDSSVLAEDDIEVGVMSQSVDCRCSDDDSDADTYVLDNTEDSDVDEDFLASRPFWQTTVKRDPYAVKECLLLTLEEVICDKTRCCRNGT